MPKLNFKYYIAILEIIWLYEKKNSFKNDIYCVYRSYIYLIYMYKKDLA